MVADQNRGLHRLGRDLRCLRNITGEDEDKNNRECQTLEPLTEWTFQARRRGIVPDQLVEADVRAIEDYKVFEQYIGNGSCIDFGPRSFDHLDYRCTPADKSSRPLILIVAAPARAALSIRRFTTAFPSPAG